MAANSEPRIYAFKADSSIANGKAVAIGSDENHVVVGSANTQRCIGIIQSEVIAAESVCEVAIQGGGAKALIGESVSAGDDLVSGTDGRLMKPNAEGDQILARAMQGGAENDLIAVEVYFATAHASQ